MNTPKTERIGEQRLMEDSLLLEWTPENCKEISDMQAISKAAMHTYMKKQQGGPF